MPGALLAACMAAAAPAEEGAGGAGETAGADDAQETGPEPAPESADGTDLTGAAEGEPAEPESGSIFERIWKDPRLDGKLHFTLRQGYVLRIHDFGRYEYPFPGSVTEDDQEQARQLEARRDDTTDQDLESYASLRAEDLYTREGGGGVLVSAGGEASFRYWKDIDGSPRGEETQGLYDGRDGRDAFQLQTLLARLKTFERHLELAVGRQFGYEAEWLHFDGGTAVFRGLKVLDREVELAAFGGSRVTYHPRHSSSHDGIGGGHFKAWLLENTRLELSNVHYLENTFEAELRQDFPGLGWAAARYRMINEFPHAVLLDAAYEKDPGFSLYLFYVGKLGRGTDDFDFDFTQSQRRTKDLDNVRYFNIGDIEPYDEVTLEGRKGFWDSFGVFAGGTVHRLRARDFEDNYNTDWQEAWVGLDATNLIWEGLTGRGTVRYIHTDLPRRRLRLPVEEVLTNGIPDFLPEDVEGDGEPGFLGLELLLEQDFARVVAVGATAVLRSYDYRSNYANLDNLQATSLGAHLRWKVTPVVQVLFNYWWDTDYEYVNPDLDSVHTLRTQVMVHW